MALTRKSMSLPLAEQPSVHRAAPDDVLRQMLTTIVQQTLQEEESEREPQRPLIVFVRPPHPLGGELAFGERGEAPLIKHVHGVRTAQLGRALGRHRAAALHREDGAGAAPTPTKGPLGSLRHAAAALRARDDRQAGFGRRLRLALELLHAAARLVRGLARPSRSLPDLLRLLLEPRRGLIGTLG